MILPDYSLIVIFLILLAVVMKLYTHTSRIRKSEGKIIPTPSNWGAVDSNVKAFLASYPLKAIGVSASLNQLKDFLDDNHLQTLDDLYQKARFSPDTVAEVKKLIEAKRISIGATENAVNSPEEGLIKLGAEVDQLKDPHVTYAKKAITYICDSKNKQLEIIDEIRRYYAMIIVGLIDLETKGPRQASRYLSPESIEEKSRLRVQIHEGVESAGKFISAAQEEYKWIANNPTKVAILKQKETV